LRNRQRQLDLPGALNVKQNGREVEILADGNSEQLLEKLRALQPEDLRVVRIAVAGGNFSWPK
jgi:acylphosphatase